MIIVLYIGAIFTVNSSADDPDANVGDGNCATSAGECTLRAAIQEANAQSGPDEIRFDVQTYKVNVTSPLYIDDELTIFGSTDMIDSILCPSCGDECLSLNAPLYIYNIYIRSGGKAIVSHKYLQATNLYIEADTFAIYSMGAGLFIRNSRLKSNYWKGIRSENDTSVGISYTYIWAKDEAFSYYSDSTLAPKILVGDTFISDTGVCATITHNGKNLSIKKNVVNCVKGGIMVYDEGSNPAVPESVFVDSNRLVIRARGATAITLNGCIGCRVLANVLEGTDTSGNFIFLTSNKHTYVGYNYNTNNAGRYNMVVLENSDSNVVNKNRWSFDVLKDSTTGITVVSGSDYNVIDTNYFHNLSRGGISILDSSSYNYSYLDTLDYTFGIQLRPNYTGTYSFPIYVDSTYTERTGTGNVFDNVYSYGYFSAMTVVGMESTLVINSHLETEKLWGYGIINAGSKLYVRNTLIKGASTSGSKGGYGISLEYYYGHRAIASEYSDDVLFSVSVENTEFRDLAYAFRVVDMDTTHIKLDTIFDNNNNSITGNTWGDYGPYFLPIVVQTLDNDCNLNISNIDSVTVEKRWGDKVNFTKLNPSDALWSFHWGSYSTVDYDALDEWYLMWAMHYDSEGNLIFSSPQTVKIYGRNGDSLLTDLYIERGLIRYNDPCPSAGYPKTVDNRWLVIKIQYDPSVLPISYPEGSDIVISIGTRKIPALKGEVVSIYTPAGRLVKRLRVQNNVKVNLPPGLYLIKISSRSYRVPVF